jgi:hypothetical protein
VRFDVIPRTHASKFTSALGVALRLSRCWPEHARGPDRADRAAGGLAVVEIGGKWGFIDKTGRMVVPPQYEGIGGFSEGRALVWESTR